MGDEIIRARLVTPRGAPAILYWSRQLAMEVCDFEESQIHFHFSDWNNNLGFEYDCFLACAGKFGASWPGEDQHRFHFSAATEEARRCLSVLMFLGYSFDWSFELCLPDLGVRMFAHDELTWFSGRLSGTMLDQIGRLAKVYNLEFELWG